MTDRAPAPADVEATAEWRERLGERLMLAMTCNHGRDYFGPGAVCNTCFANVQRIGRLVEREIAASPALATLRAHERANALRDAADELHRLWVKDGRHYGHPGCYSSGYEVWLRDRADRQEPQP